MNPLQVDHPYYTSESNYFSNECTTTFESWAEYLIEWADYDVDMNLIIRWDWHPTLTELADNAKWLAEHPEYADEQEDETPTLQIARLGQRKGKYTVQIVRNVTEADVPAIKAHLLPHFERILENWAPISDDYMDAIDNEGG